MGRGRPSKYSADYPKIAEEICREFGAIDEQLAKTLGISYSTLGLWKKEHPEFSDAIRRGKRAFDSEKIEVALVQRALGYSHPEEKIFCSDGELVTYQTVKHYPPDVGAIKHWQCNRQPGEWSDSQRHEISGPNGGPMQMHVDRPPDETREEWLARHSKQQPDD